MVKKAQAVIIADWGNNRTRSFSVKYNPKEFTLEKGIQLGEIKIPGLDAPLQQFVRGQGEKLTVELFFDSTEDGMGKDATSVTKQTDEIYKLVKVEHASHAPPIVTFCWNSHFPGDTLTFGNSSAGENGNQSRNSFKGVVSSLRQQFTLFSPEGVPLRAKLNLTLVEYRTLQEQLDQLRLNSPDKTHSHVLQSGETLSFLAGKYYGDTSKWRYIASENGITDPRRTTPGDILVVPAIDQRVGR